MSNAPPKTEQPTKTEQPETQPPESQPRINVQIADDRMQASIGLRRCNAEGPLTKEEVLEALVEAKVIVDDAVKQCVDAFMEMVLDEEQKPPESFVVAEGRPPDEGHDEELKWDPAYDKALEDWQGDASVNYYNLSSIVIVEKDVAFGNLTAYAPACSGADVLGRLLESKRTPRRLELHESVRLGVDDPSQLISNVAGKVVQCGNKLLVDEVVHIKGDISFATGNIDAPAEVHITGAVPDRFTVKSAKSITVGGVIEAADVEAKGDVVVRGGIIGRNTGKVIAGGNITAKFCAEATLSAGGDVMVGKQMMNSKVRAKGRLIAEQVAVIGGHIYAAAGVDVAALGTNAGTPTNLFVGARPDALAECAAIDKRLQPTRDVVRKINDSVKPLMNNLKRLTGAQREQATEMAFKADEAQLQVDKEESRRDELLRAAGGGETPHVRVSSVIHPHVSIHFGNRTINIDKELKGPVSIEVRQINNVTEVVAVNQLTGSIQTINSQQLAIDRLLKEYEPLIDRTTEESDEK